MSRRVWVVAAVGVCVVVVGAGSLAVGVAEGPSARGIAERFLTRRLRRPVHLAGMRLHLLSAVPSGDLYGVRIGQPAWAGSGDMIVIAHIRVRMPWSALGGGPLQFDELEMDGPTVRLLRREDGRANWSFDAGTAARGAPLRLPFVKRLTIRGGRLSVDDRPREVGFAGPVYTDPTGALRLRLAGRLKAEPFNLALDGASLAALRPDRPYAVAGSARAGATGLSVRVRLARPFDFGHVVGDAAASGDTLHGLSDVIGVSLPNTPKFALTTGLSRDGSRFTLKGLSGRVADSDVHGSLRLDTVDGRRRLTGALRSDHLQLGDLLAVIGGQSGAPDAVARRRADAKRGPHRLLSDSALKPSWFRKLDTRVAFASDDVHAGRLPMRRLSFTVALERGVLTVRPLRMQFARGVFDGGIRMDARTDVPATELDGSLAGFRAEGVLGLVLAPPALEGPLDGRLRLRGRGLSLHRTAASATGGAVLVMGAGQAQRSYAQLLGGDVVGGVKALSSHDAGGTALRCAAVGLRATAGRAVIGALTIDTDPAVVDGTGWVDLGAETFLLRLTGTSKRPRLVRAPAPATLAGPWRKPHLSIDRGRLVKSGVAGVVSTVLSPIKALLPGLGPKPAADVDCRALAARAAAFSGEGARPARPGRSAPTGAGR